MKPFISLFVLPVFVLAANASTEESNPEKSANSTEPSAALESLARDMLKPSAHYRDSLAKTLAEIYAERKNRPVWKNPPGRDALKSQLLPLLKKEGISSTGLREKAGIDVSSKDLPVPADDVRASVQFLDAAFRVRHGKMAPSELWSAWEGGDLPGEKAAHEDLDQEMIELFTAADPPSPEAVMRAATPRNWIYENLSQAYRDWEKNLEAKSGAFTPLPDLKDDQIIQEGDSYSHARALAKKLADEGFLKEAEIDKVTGPKNKTMTPELTKALSDFQRDYALLEDGILGPNTLELLNLSPEEKLKILDLNLQRARLLPDTLGKRYVLVNLPSGRVYAFDSDGFELSMRIIFGKAVPNRETPIFRDVMQLVVFRPFWNIPVSIAKNEIVPQALENRGYLYEKNYQIVRSFGPEESPLEPTYGRLQAVKEGKLKMRQAAGPGNALGLIKFLFPNHHAVYLHDTPEDQLFERSKRDFSHGCIRLQKPAEMGEWVLGPQGWSRSEIEAAMHGDERQVVEVENEVNVFITYFTALPDPRTDSKKVRFFADVYGRDRLEPAADEDQAGP